MVIEKNLYKLAEYQIAEYEDGILWWHTHHGLGQERCGRCFIHGDILIIGQFSHEKNGFLKREFLGKLGKLPTWSKTEFYCHAHELFDISSSKSLNQDWSGQIASLRKVREQNGKDDGPGTFRLDRYRINVGRDGQISWQALEGGGRVSGGPCVIQSGILFLETKEFSKEGQSRRDFLKELNEITPWNRTAMWGHSLSLRPCKSLPQTGRNTIRWRDKPRDHRYGADRGSAFWKGKQKIPRSRRPSGQNLKMRLWPRKLFPSGFKLRKPSWPQQDRRKVRLALLIPLLLAGLLLGVVLGLHSLKESAHHDHSSRERHHRKERREKRSKKVMEKVMNSKKGLLFLLIPVALVVGAFHATTASGDGDDQRHRNRYRERHHDRDHGDGHLKAVTDPTYKENCGACHFAYQPELLPSASWKNILNRADDHFGESLALDEEAKTEILGYLQTNGAEHSSAKRAVRIMRSLGSQVPTRITEIPYIRGKHHDISAATIMRRSIGSLSNCIACHTRAEEGIYDDDFVVIPK